MAYEIRVEQVESVTITPAGTVATTIHMGPYNRLGEAHDAIVRWCRANHRDPTGISREIYGHWDDDPERLGTDAYYLLDA